MLSGSGIHKTTFQTQKRMCARAGRIQKICCQYATGMAETLNDGGSEGAGEVRQGGKTGIRLQESRVKVAQSRRTLCDAKDCSPPGSPVPGILQARILE